MILDVNTNSQRYLKRQNQFIYICKKNALFDFSKYKFDYFLFLDIIANTSE